MCSHSQFTAELCADQLVVGGGVGWSYDRRRRSAAHFSSAAAAWLYWRGGGGVRPDERALKQRTRWTCVFLWFYRGQPLHL